MFVLFCCLLLSLFVKLHFVVVVACCCTHPNAAQQQGIHFAAILCHRHCGYHGYGRLLLHTQVDRHFLFWYTIYIYIYNSLLLLLLLWNTLVVVVFFILYCTRLAIVMHYSLFIVYCCLINYTLLYLLLHLTFVLAVAALEKKTTAKTEKHVRNAIAFNWLTL